MLFGLETGTATMEISMANSQNYNKTTTITTKPIWHNYATPGFMPKGLNIWPHKYLLGHLCSHSIDNS